MSSTGTATSTFMVNIEGILKTAWGDIEQVGDGVLNAFEKTAQTVWAAVSSESVAFVQGVLTVYSNDLKSGTMSLTQATSVVTSAAETAGVAELKNLGSTALQALLANLIAAL